MSQYLTLLGTERPYPHTDARTLLPPSGYIPVFINHLGRHGSRYMTSPNEVLQLMDFLTAAMQLESLTIKGINLYQYVLEFISNVKGKWGTLTSIGFEEQFQIATRMYYRFPQVFGKDIFTISTYVPRAIQSMDAFLSAFDCFMDQNLFSKKINKKEDPLLRFFDSNEAYVHYKSKGSWIKEWENFRQRNDTALKFLSQFSTKLPDTMEETLHLTTTIYNIHCNAFNITGTSFLNRYFNYGTMNYYWQNSNVKNYLEKGPAGCDVTLPMDISYRLLENMIETADHALKEGSISAYLRFAHAETLIPFVGLIQLCAFGKQSNALCNISTFWKDWVIAPMAANIQFIYYQGPNKPTLVKILYNEKEACLPLKSIQTNYYEWNRVKEFFCEILEKIPDKM